MRKHFLLLFLMALLPLAGFAASTVDISTADVTITLEENSPVYNNAVQAPTITKVVVNNVEYTSEWTQFFTPKYYKRNTIGNWIPQNADQIQDAGEYAVAIVANGATDAEPEITYTADKESDDAHWAFYTIQKKDLNVTLANGTKQYGGTDPTELVVTPTNLPDGWTAPEFTWTGTLPIEGAHANVNAEGYDYDFPQNTLTGQTYVSSVNYNVFITNQPKLIVTKKQIALNYIGTAVPVKTYGVGNTTETLGLNEDFLTAILNKANYEEPGTSELVGGDVLADVLAGLTAAKVVVSLDWATEAGESANAYNDATPIVGGDEHKVKFTIDESVATNYKFTVSNVNLTVKQAELSAAANAPFTFAKAETAPFTYNAADQTLTKTITYTANNEQLLAEGADPAVTPQVTVSYKYKTLGTDGDATTAVSSAGDFTAAGVYEAYVAPVAADGNFYTESGDPIRVTALDYTINKKDLYLYVNDDAITKTYQGSAYTLPESDDITFQGLMASDETTLATDIAAVKAIVDGTAATPVYTVKDAKTYTIVPYVAETNKLNDNYAVQTYTSTFTVSPLAITIDPNDMLDVVYGTAIAGTADADATAVTGNVTVAKNTATDPDIVLADQAKVLSAYQVVVADQTYAAGNTYVGAITLVKKELDPEDADDLVILNMLDNFTITPGTGDVTIGTGTYQIVVKNKNKTYGDELAWSLFDYLTPGLTGTTKPASVKFILVNTADTDETYSQNDGDDLPKNAGTYTIKVDAANSNLDIVNYTTPTEAAGTLIAGELTIAPKVLTIVTAEVKVNEGATVDALNTLGKGKVSFTGLVQDDVIAYKLAFNTSGGGAVTVDATSGNLTSAAAENAYAAGYKVVAMTPAEISAAGTEFANANYKFKFGDAEAVEAIENANATGALKVETAQILVISATAENIIDQLTAAATDAAATEDTSDDVYTLKIQNHYPWDAGTWNTMVLPFDITVAELSAAMKPAATAQNANPVGYAIVNRMDTENSTPSAIKFNLFMGTIPANEPFLIKAAEEIDFTNVEISGKISTTKLNDPSIEGQNGVKYTGLYTTKADLSTTERTVSKSKWYSNWTGFGLTAFEAYFSGCNAAARIFIEDLDGNGVTAIKTLDMDTKTATPVDGWYTLNGVKLQGAPTEKGIYINNGKKVVIK